MINTMSASNADGMNIPSALTRRAPDKEGGGGRGLGAELGVLLGEDETAESGVAFRFLRRKCRFVRGQLLGRECLDSRDDGRELLVGCDLLR